MILPTISSLFYIIFNKNILNPLRFVRRQRQQHQQYTTSFLQNHKTKPLQHRQQQKQLPQNQRQLKEEQKHRYCHINCLNNNNYKEDNNDDDDFDENDYDGNNNNNIIDYNDNYNNHNNVGGEIKTRTTKSLRKLPCKSYKNEIQNSHSCKCQRHVIIATAYTNPNSYTNGINTNDMRHVLR